MGRPLKIAKAQAVLTITDTATAGSVVTVTQNLTTNPTVGVLAGMPFTVATNVGGLLAGTTYYVNQILSNTTFSVSATQLSVQPQVMAPLSDTTGGSVAATVGIVDYAFSNPDGSNTATNSTSYGVVGGNTALYGPQALVRVALGLAGAGTVSTTIGSNALTGFGTTFIASLSAGSVVTTSDGIVLGYVNSITNDTAAVLTSNSTTTVSGTEYVFAINEPGYIVRQKGKTKYLVTGTVTGLTGQCSTANVANAVLTPNTMNILATFYDASTAYVQSLNDYQSQVFPTQVNVGALIAGTAYTIYNSGNTDWTAVGSASNQTGVTFIATASGSGTGTAILANANPDVISTFGTAYAANTYPGENPITGQTSAVSGQPNPIVTISNA